MLIGVEARSVGGEWPNAQDICTLSCRSSTAPAAPSLHHFSSFRRPQSFSPTSTRHFRSPQPGTYILYTHAPNGRVHSRTSTWRPVAAVSDIVDLDLAGVATLIIVSDGTASRAACVADMIVGSLHYCACSETVWCIRDHDAATYPDEVAPAVSPKVPTVASCQRKYRSRSDGAAYSAVP
jgi:hypothetical protein